MRNYKETDKILRDRLGQYDSGAPMHLFDKIEEGLKDEPNNKGGIWWWSLGLLLLFVGSTSWYVIYNNNSTNEQSASISTVTTETNLQSTEATKPQFITTSETIQEASSKDLSSTSTLENEISVHTTAPKTISKKITSSTSNIYILQNETVETSLPEVSSPTQFVEHQQVGQTEFSTKGISAKLESLSTSSSTLKREPILTAQQLKGSSSLMKVTSNSKIPLPDVIKCGDKKDRNFDFNITTSMDLFVSPERSFRFLEYKSSDSQEYAARRNETEKPYYSFSSGLRLNFLMDSGFALRTGLVYSQINEIFEEQFLETRILTDPTSGDTLGFSQYLNDVTTFNRYKMVDVPVLLGYEMRMKRSTINVNAGVYVNVSATQKGTFLSPDNEQKKDFTTGTGDYQAFRKNIGLSYFMSIGAAYELSPQYQFFFEPNVRFYPKSFTRNEYVLNQKYVTGGIILGIRKRL